MLGPAENCFPGRGNETVTRTVYSKWSRHIVVIKLQLAHVIQIHDAVGRFGRYKLYRPTLQVGRLPEQWRFSEDLTVWGSLCVLSGEPRFLIPQTGNLGEGDFLRQHETVCRRVLQGQIWGSHLCRVPSTPLVIHMGQGHNRKPGNLPLREPCGAH